MSSPSPHRITFSLFTVAACALLTVSAWADSQARIVRLSDVQGAVQIDKNTGLGFESAFVNFPVTQGAKLRTGDRARAEVEFEDGSSLRLTPNTTVEFGKLGLNDAGKRISGIKLVSGMAYVNWLGKDDLALDFSQHTISLDRSAHFRLDASGNLASLAVFKGDVDVNGPDGKLTVQKKKTATFNADDKYTVANNVVEAPLDAWDKEATSYHDQYAKNNSSPYGYGVSDLNYYGSYSNIPGYGMMWQPYFTGIGWDPFMDGAWGYYPGLGYMFASAYPWGWMPYRYGNWMFVPNFGWMWQPGGWGGWLSTPHYTPTTLVHVNAPVPPAKGTVKTVVVGKAGMSTAVFSPRVNAGSAGLGIPRGSVRNLNHVNREVAKSGSAVVQPAPQFGAVSGSHPNMNQNMGGSRASSSARAPMAAPRASAPAAHPSSGGTPHR